MPTFKEIVDLLKKGATLEAQQQLVELQEVHLKTREENMKLREQVAALQKELEDRHSLIWERPYYFKLKDDGSKDGPFCQVCKDSHGKLIRLIESTGAAYRYRCAVCTQVYELAPEGGRRIRGLST